MKKNLPQDPELMAQVVAKLAIAALTNAGRLTASAEALLAGGGWPTAFSVAALGFEELGKASMCMTMLAMPPAVREEFRKTFNQAFTDHEQKAGFAHVALALVAEETPASVERMLADAVDAAKRTNAIKFRGLYVDYTDQGGLLNPTDVTEAEARWIVAKAKQLLEAMRPTAKVVDPAELVEIARQWQDGMDFDALGAWFEADPDAVFAAMRTMAKGEPEQVPPYLLGGFAPKPQDGHL